MRLITTLFFMALILMSQTFETTKCKNKYLNKYNESKRVCWDFGDDYITFKHLDGKMIIILNYYNYPPEQEFRILNTETRGRKIIYTVESEIYFGKIIFKNFSVKVKLYDKIKNKNHKDFYSN
jgi:hypothetical protein